MAGIVLLYVYRQGVEIMIKTIYGYAMGVAVFGFVCSLIGIDLDVALITISQAVGRPYLPYISW